MQVLDCDRVARAVAECIPGGSPEDPLGQIKCMSNGDLRELCRQKVAERLQGVFEGERRKMHDGVARVVEGEGGKIDQRDGKYGAELKFGDLSEYFGGLVEKIGLPDPYLMRGMEREHCEKEDAGHEFKPGNYDITTTPRAEWKAVTDPQEGQRVSVGPRRIKAVSGLMEVTEARNAGLTEAEMTALVLYTGPMFRKYNAVLRQFPEDDVKNLGGNIYATTIHCIVSGVIKLSKDMALPEGRNVYRGLAGDKDLPRKFKTADDHGVRGGVEYGLMSTTLDKKVALQYAGSGSDGNLPTIFEIGLSAVSRGASLGFLSQFEREAEILLPPLSFLEVVGDTRIEVGEDGKQVRLVPLAASANVTGSTIEDIVGKRKQLHVFQMENAVHEIRRKLGDLSSSREAMQRHKSDPFSHVVSVRSFVGTILRQAERVLEMSRSRAPEWYNVEGQSQCAMRELSEVRSLAVGMFEYWLNSPTAVIAWLSDESMHDVDRRRTAQLMHEIGNLRLHQGNGCTMWASESSAPADSKEESMLLRDRALELCRRRGALISSIDEQNEHGEPPLVAAGALGDVLNIRLLLAAGCKLGSASKNGQTGLHLASKLGFEDAARILLEASADVHAVDGKKMTCLHVASEAGHVQIVAMLVDRGGKELVETANHLGQTPLLMTAQHGHHRVLQALITSGADVNRSTKKGRTALMWASLGGHIDCIEILVAAGADVNALDQDGRSCIMSASSGGHLECVRRLLGAGADINAANKNGWSAALEASSAGHLDCLRFLLDAGAKVTVTTKNGETALLKALAHRHVQCALLLIDAGIDVDAAGKDQQSPLVIASAGGHLECVEALIKAGAKIDSAGKDKEPPIVKAFSAGHSQCTRALVAAGADTGAKNKKGWTALMWASSQGELDCVRELLAAKADVHAEDKMGQTAILLAASGGHVGCLGALIAAGANSGKAVGSKSAFPLMAASLGGHVDCLGALLDAGADANSAAASGKDFGKTSLICAASQGHLRCVKVLVNAGASLEACDKDGKTAIEWASQGGHSECVEVLMGAKAGLGKDAAA